VDNSQGLPYESNLWPNEKYQHCQQRAYAHFESIRVFQGNEILTFAFTVDAKMPWRGRLHVEAHDETGKIISHNLPFNVV